jgi:CheY-like chemotaxis protein
MSGKRLLVVDDEQDFGEFVQDVAEDLGYEVRAITNGTEFRGLYQNFQPSTIVLDIVMPDVDGLEIIQWLSEIGTTAKIVVVTGYNPRYAKMAELLVDAKGTSEVITLIKPVALEDIRNALS